MTDKNILDKLLDEVEKECRYCLIHVYFRKETRESDKQQRLYSLNIARSSYFAF